MRLEGSLQYMLARLSNTQGGHRDFPKGYGCTISEKAVDC